MLNSITIIFVACVYLITAQLNIIDDRYVNRIPQPLSLPLPPPPPLPYIGAGYNINLPNNNHHNNHHSNNNHHSSNNHHHHHNHNDGIVDEFGQCGGLDWEGLKTCRASLICVKRSKYYAQCLSPEAAAAATRPAPQVIPPGGKCHGGNIRGPLACAIGTACFIQTESIHGECKSHCPQGWFCAQQTLPEWAPCGGEGYVGLTKCKEGLQCFSHSKWYHECRSECPDGWKC